MLKLIHIICTSQPPPTLPQGHSHASFVTRFIKRAISRLWTGNEERAESLISGWLRDAENRQWPDKISDWLLILFYSVVLSLLIYKHIMKFTHIICYIVNNHKIVDMNLFIYYFINPPTRFLFKKMQSVSFVCHEVAWFCSHMASAHTK